jgi:hypothetical protein
MFDPEMQGNDGAEMASGNVWGKISKDVILDNWFNGNRGGPRPSDAAAAVHHFYAIDVMFFYNCRAEHNYVVLSGGGLDVYVLSYKEQMVFYFFFHNNAGERERREEDW